MIRASDVELDQDLKRVLRQSSCPACVQVRDSIRNQSAKCHHAIHGIHALQAVDGERCDGTAMATYLRLRARREADKVKVG